MLVMGVEQGEAHGGRENRVNVSEELRTWFCQLSTQERVQVRQIFASRRTPPRRLSRRALLLRLLMVDFYQRFSP